jgi:hypothetical protein
MSNVRPHKTTSNQRSRSTRWLPYPQHPTTPIRGRRRGAASPNASSTASWSLPAWALRFDTLAVAEIQFRSGQLITVISGGTPPYRYSVSPFDGESKSARVSKDGWLFESIPRSLAAGSQVVVEATDSKDRKATKAATYAQKDRDATAPAPGGQPSTAQPQSPPSAPASPASK